MLGSALTQCPRQCATAQCFVSDCWHPVGTIVPLSDGGSCVLGSVNAAELLFAGRLDRSGFLYREWGEWAKAGRRERCRLGAACVS